MKNPQNLFWLVSLGLVLIAVPAQAITLEAVPNPRTAAGAPIWVSDTANLISAGSEAKLNRMLSELEVENGTEMAIVTVNETASFSTPRAFTTELFNAWGVGKAAQNNGVLFLISVGDRRAEVVVGYGLESVLTQSKVESLLSQQAVSDFKQANYDKGISDASRALVAQLSHPYLSHLYLPIVSMSVVAKILAGGSGAITLLIAWFVRKPPTCKDCQIPLKQLDKRDTAPHLRKAQKISQQIGSASYTGWHCPTCSEILIKRRRNLLSGYSNCPECHEPTAQSTKEILIPATYTHSGQAQVTKSCQCCHSVTQSFITIAQRSRSSSSSSRNFSGGKSGGGGGGASW
jgi:uncharacterized protein